MKQLSLSLSLSLSPSLEEPVHNYPKKARTAVNVSMSVLLALCFSLHLSHHCCPLAACELVWAVVEVVGLDAAVTAADAVTGSCFS
jgi:hypothetical protein